MSALRPDLVAIVEDLVRGSAKGGAIALDAIGEAIGTRAITPPEIDAMLSEIEARGRRVVSAEGGRGELHLKSVIVAARELRVTLGRSPRPDELAAHAHLTIAEVQHALALARVMQR